MLVIIKSAPQTDEARRGLGIAKETGAGLVLMQSGVYMARQGGLEGFTGLAYVVDEDVRLRGIGAEVQGLKSIGYGDLVDLMADDEKVIGMF